MNNRIIVILMEEVVIYNNNNSNFKEMDQIKIAWLGLDQLMYLVRRMKMCIKIIIEVYNRKKLFWIRKIFEIIELEFLSICVLEYQFECFNKYI